MKNHLLLLSIALLALAACTKEKLPIIKASSYEAHIKVDGKLKDDIWYLDPNIELDVFSTPGKEVTFYTDIDSITFKTETNKNYDFVVLLNEKDSAMTRIACIVPKLEILKKAEAYNYSDNRFIPEFTYSLPDDPYLEKTRKELKLDSIAGNGTELSQIFNLLHWIHTTIRHDGNSINPDSKNAIDIIKICKAENRGVNCRMMAIALNECYLSMGIKSKYITCMPRETIFDDCHVINMVFSKELDKWIWIDPTFEAYVKDENGNLLGIQEVRERLIKGQELILNPDANWNGNSAQTKEYYLDQYMAKNLYRMQVPANNGYNIETQEKGKEISFVELLPLDGIQQEPQKDEDLNTDTGTKYIYYKTNNPDLFWAKPE